MAKVNFGTIANDARGKINGSVYSKNKSGSYVRRKVSPANPQSPTQSSVRTNFAHLTQAWGGTLNEAQRQAWNVYAQTYPRLDVFGNSIQITGHNMFISLNQRLLQIGVALITNPPPSNIVVPIPFSVGAGDLLMAAPGTATFSQTAAATGAASFYVFGTGALPPGRQPQQNDFRFFAQIAASVGPYPAVIDFYAGFAARYGSVVAGTKYAVLVATIDPTTGLVTPGTIGVVVAT